LQPIDSHPLRKRAFLGHNKVVMVGALSHQTKVTHL